jgi:putative Mg2+ transporter-C (MgtC) family protein
VTLGAAEVFLRFLAAGALGAGVGFERELHGHEAGTRTHLLLALGACMFTVVGAYGFHGFVKHGQTVDPTRVAAQIVTGIGFLGGGAILRQGLTVRGLTTASSLWVAAAIGIACGAGWYWAAVAGAGLTFLALWPLQVIEERLVDRASQSRGLTIELERGQSIASLLVELGDLRRLGVADEADRRVVTVELAGAFDHELIARLADLAYVKSVRESR